MSQLPPDPYQNENSGSNKFNDANNGSSDPQFHQENNSSTDLQRQSPSSEPNSHQEQMHRRGGRQPRRMKEKKLSPRPQKLLSPDNLMQPPPISQVSIPDGDHAPMNQISACQFQMPMMQAVSQVQPPMALASGDNAANASTMGLQGVHPIRPLPGSQAAVIQPVMYPNNKISLNQMNVQVYAAMQNQLMNLNNESLELLLNLFEIQSQNFTKPQYIDAFMSFMSSIIYMMPQNFSEFIFFLFQQLSNKSSSPLILQLTNPPIPVVFQQSIDKKIIYKFAPLYNKNIEIPPNNSIESEYAIIATIIPPNPQVNGNPIIVNGQQTQPVAFGEVNEKNYYLISPMAKGRNPSISFSIRINPKIYQTFCWVVFYYVLPAPMTQIERFAGIEPPIKGVRTEKCQENCSFSFFDFVHKIYGFGYYICPNCRQKVFLTKIIPIKLHMRQMTHLDAITSSFACHYDSTIVEPYDYFSKHIDVNATVEQDQKETSDDDDFDPDKYIKDAEDYCLSVLKNDAFK